MSRVVLLVVGAVVTLAGLTFALQGLGVLGGSAMTGVTAWAILGPIIAGFGVALLIRGFRSRPRP